MSYIIPASNRLASLMKWQQRTDIELFNDKDLDKLFHLRGKYPTYQFSSDDIQAYLSHVSRIEQDYLERIAKYKEGFLDILQGTKHAWIISNGVVPTPAKTIAETLLNLIVQPYLKSALRFYNKQHVPLFLMDVDFSFGIVEIPSAIIGASTEGEGGGREAVDYGMIYALKHYGTQQSQEIDRIYNNALKTSLYQRKLFEKDRSGNVLLSSVISCLEAGEDAHPNEEYHHSMLPWHNKTLYLTGCYFGKKIYEGLYTLWQQEGFTYVPA